MSFEYSDHLPFLKKKKILEGEQDNQHSKYFNENNLESKEFERHLEDLLIHYKRINEGAEGIIGLIDLNEYDSEDLKNFFGEEVLDEIGVDKRLAVKMLKVYIDGRRAVEEGNLQKNAREALLQAGITDVSIPKVYYNNELEITSPTLRAELESDEVYLKDNKVGIILMDLIPGQDLSDFLLKETIKRHPDLKEYRDQDVLDSMDYKNLESIVAIGLGQQQISDQEDAYIQRQKEKQNDKLLINFLSKTDFILNPEILNRLEKALPVLHKAGIYHRDLHKRNLMFSNTTDGNLEQVYIIDFGKSIETKSTSRDDIYIEDDIIYKEDEYLLRIYKSLTRPRSDQEKEAYFLTLARPLLAIQQNEKLKKSYVSFFIKSQKKLESIKEGKDYQQVIKKIDRMIQDFSNSVISETASQENFNLQLALWNELATQDPDSIRYIIDSLKEVQKRNSNRSPYFYNQVAHLISYLEENQK